MSGEQGVYTNDNVGVRVNRTSCFVRTCLRMQLAYNFAQTDTALHEAGGLPCDIHDCDIALAPMSGGQVVVTAGAACLLGNDTVDIDYGS